MKKIIGAALLGTMAAGVFAADAKINLNFRHRLDAFSQVKVDSDDEEEKGTVRNWMNQNGYNGPSADDFSFQLDGENAGAKVIWEIDNENMRLSAKQYFGYMRFNAGPGVLTLEAGRWNNGYADDAYRVNADARNLEGLDFERFKLGTIFAVYDEKGEKDKTSNDIKGLTFVDDLNFGGNVSGFASYKFNVNNDIFLNLTVGGVQKDNFDTYKDGDTTTNWKSALASRIQFGMKNLLNAEFIYKKWAPRYNTFALYLMPQVMDALTLNVGGAVETFSGNRSNEKYTDWAVDLRLRYQVMDPLSVTFFTNISGTNVDKGRAIAAGIVGNDDDQTEYGNAWIMNDTDFKFKTVMWNQLGARYVVNDALTATFNVGLISLLKKGDGNNSPYGPEWRVVPGVEVFADKNASIWAAVALSGAMADDDKGSVFAVNIPVIFRVKM